MILSCGITRRSSDRMVAEDALVALIFTVSVSSCVPLCSAKPRDITGGKGCQEMAFQHRETAKIWIRHEERFASRFIEPTTNLAIGSQKASKSAAPPCASAKAPRMTVDRTRTQSNPPDLAE